MLIYVSVGKRVLWASLYEWVLANISNKVRNKNGQIGFANVIKPHVMWLLYRNFILSQLFSNLVYYNLYMQIWEVHISTLKWNEMKNLLQNTEREREREREREVPSDGSVVAVWAFEMRNDTRKKNTRR